jgi:glycosyltransferase involved in cell wall biosynthesis
LRESSAPAIIEPAKSTCLRPSPASPSKPVDSDKSKQEIDVEFQHKRMKPDIAILVPCHNEEASIGAVVAGFRDALPSAKIYVYDNNSTDRTAEIARAAGAIVRHEKLQGKGRVVRRMFRDIDADFYLLVDGDDTYDVSVSSEMLRIAQQGPHDLVNCVRMESGDDAFRVGGRSGNIVLTGVVRRIFGDHVQDMLSGYKALSRRFVKSFPVLSQGFDIETELTVHALELSMPIAHVRGVYCGRAEGASESKLRTFRDGWRILLMILKLIRHERPFFLYGVISVILALIAVLIAIPVIVDYSQTGLVLRLPTAVLATGIMLFAGLSILAGLMLDTVTRGRREVRMLAYLQHSPFCIDASDGERNEPKVVPVQRRIDRADRH